MRLLLDTHTLLWWWDDSPKLSRRARSAILDKSNAILISAASSWEIATKFRLGKSEFGAEAYHRHRELIEADGFAFVPIDAGHGLRAGSYPFAHRDPFDRMLAAQSEIEGAALVTCDAKFVQFPVEIIW